MVAKTLVHVTEFSFAKFTVARNGGLNNNEMQKYMKLFNNSIFEILTN